MQDGERKTYEKPTLVKAGTLAKATGFTQSPEPI